MHDIRITGWLSVLILIIIPKVGPKNSFVELEHRQCADPLLDHLRLGKLWSRHDIYISVYDEWYIFENNVGEWVFHKTYFVFGWFKSSVKIPYLTLPNVNQIDNCFVLILFVFKTYAYFIPLLYIDMYTALNCIYGNLTHWPRLL